MSDRATMPAAVYQGDRRVALERLPVPEPGPGEVVVEVSHCGICGSDLHMVLEGWGRPGSTGGHEYSGVVVATGPGVRDWHAGDRVIAGPGPGCGECSPCAEGHPHLCLGRSKAGIDPSQGAFAAFVKVGADALYAVPDGLDLRTAALTEPLAVAVHAVSRAEPRPDRPVLVTGAGPIGLLVVAVLVDAGVTDVTVSEPGSLRRDRALALGARRAVAPEAFAEPPLPMDVVEEPFAVAFECSGHAAAMESALAQLGRRGTLVLVGAGVRRPRFDPNRILLNELSVTGAVEYTPGDYRRSIDLLASGRLPVDLLVEPDDVPLAGLLPAMERLAAGELAGKVMVIPREEP